ncbi:hypothetical protein J2Y48_002457 [Mycoplana sp. BE70]|nr:hypothetical protein [Mycoplana sp. BE70]
MVIKPGGEKAATGSDRRTARGDEIVDRRAESIVP